MSPLTSPTFTSLAVASGLLLGILVWLELGFRVGLRAVEKHPGTSHEGIGAMEGAIFALLGLLLGFSYSGATSRLEARRNLIVQEANAIGTAYLRIDLLPGAGQPEVRRLFRDYLDARIGMYQALPDMPAAEQELSRAAQLQQEIWSKAAAASRDDSTHDSARLLLPAINDMMDFTTSRTVALHTRLPNLIFGLLILLALLSGLLAGYGMAQRQLRSRFHMLLFAGAIALTVYVVLDLDNPTAGLIRLDKAHNALVQVRDSMR